MTGEEAIGLLGWLEITDDPMNIVVCKTWFGGINTKMKEALDMAIKALEQEPCEDAISRSATLEKFKKIYFDNATVIRCAELVLGGMPSVQPKVKKGHWIDDCGNLKCPYCETVVRDVQVFSPLTKYTNACWFCPICGADMREVKE